ncbi:MAG: threonylcarbamoyl-AMP synthase [Nitrospiraceae bacterium]|jgi:L-threonylcarbamoyladenylate synthase|nr:threonylcarbamoyl-AMP synthase [Nitrospiraceae bacterium]
MDLLTPSADTIARTVSVLNAGGIAAYPTETFYGLGARFDRADAVDRIYVLKHRPPDKALPVIIADREQLFLLAASVPATAEILIDRFWPGPLTLILPALPGLTNGIVHEQKIAVRIPGPSFAFDLVNAAGFPITSTSANPSGQPPAATAGMIREYFPHGIDLLIDGGTAASSLPSTIVDLCGDSPRILREGAIPPASLFSALR